MYPTGTELHQSIETSSEKQEQEQVIKNKLKRYGQINKEKKKGKRIGGCVYEKRFMKNDLLPIPTFFAWDE